jgi:hypothetical protein
MAVVPDIDGVTPVPGGRTTCVLESAAHRARDRDIHAAVTRAVIRRRVGRHRPGRRARRNNSRDNAYHYQYGAAFTGRERVGRRGLASVDRGRLLRAADLIELTITAALLVVARRCISAPTSWASGSHWRRMLSARRSRASLAVSATTDGVGLPVMSALRR